MSTKKFVPDFFTAGGTLPPDAPSYVKRPADDELFHHIISGEFCNILTPRQMGKSSLMIRTAQRLRNEGYKSAVVDLTQIGIVEREQWYKGVLTTIKRRLKLSMDPVSWWDKKGNVSSTQKFIVFFEELLLEIKENVVIFIDEIDSTLSLNFRDEIFTGIRSIYNMRADQPEYNRLSFVLLGVASPSDLIIDRTRTPYNIGQEIHLANFSRQDAKIFEGGLEQIYPGEGNKILDRVFYWTDGHPYLTQKLCSEITEKKNITWDQKNIDLLVEDLFLSEQARRETNLKYVQDKILTSNKKNRLISTYKKILQGKEKEDIQSPTQNELKLTGLVIPENGVLRVRNKIYQKMFDYQWAKKNTEWNWRIIVSYALTLLAVSGFIYLSLSIYNDIQYISNQPNISPVCFNNDSHPPQKRLECLADLFDPDTKLIPYDNSLLARDIFFGQPNWNKQKSIFMAGEQNPEDLQVVIEGLYVSLADVDNSGQTTKLLKTMMDALKKANLEDSDLGIELKHWIAARELSSLEDKDHDAILSEFDLAISKNPDNPATHFERARIYILRNENNDLENALEDYEKVVALSLAQDPPQSEDTTATPTATPTNTPTNTPTITPTYTPTITPTYTPTITATLTSLVYTLASPPNTTTPTSTASITVTPSETSESASYPSPIPTPDNTPVQSFFKGLYDRIEAVKNDINQNADLRLSLFSTNPDTYPNLYDWVVFSLTAIEDTPTPSSFFPATTKSDPNNLFLSNCRSGPDVGSAILTQIPPGEILVVLGKNNDQGNWLLVQSDKSIQCWIDASLLDYEFDLARIAITNNLISIEELTTTPNSNSLFVGNDGMPLVYIPAGEFPMGSTANELDERPVHTVFLNDYLIDQTEITNAMYALCVDDGRCVPPRDNSSILQNASNNSFYFGNPDFDNYPVIFVSWNDANNYCGWADRRLPTEAEWEKAASWDDNSQTKRLYPWGNEIDCSYANYWGDGDRLCVGDTTPVGNYPKGASFYGVLDMAGNVWEWVSDRYYSEYYDNSAYNNPLGPASGNLTIIRGGSFLTGRSVGIRSSDRESQQPDYTSYAVGFRCATDISFTSTSTPFVTPTITLTPPSCPILVKPSLSGNNNGRNVKLSWTSVSGASNYQIYRSVNGSNYSIIGSTSGTNLDDSIDNGSTHNYYIIATNNCGNFSTSNIMTISR